MRNDTQPSLLRALFDTQLRYLLTPALMPWVYRGCMWVVITSTAFWFWVAWFVAAWTNGWAWGLFGLLVVPVVGFVLLIFARVMCEAVIRWFARG